jgi:hypothetical protein
MNARKRFFALASIMTASTACSGPAEAPVSSGSEPITTFCSIRPEPVCGQAPGTSYGETYLNSCWMSRAGATFVANGDCPRAGDPCGTASESRLCVQGYVCSSGTCIGQPITLASGQDGPRGIAVDQFNVYWANQGSGDGPDGSVMAVPLAGGATTTIATGLWQPFGLALEPHLSTARKVASEDNVWSLVWGTLGSDAASPTGSVMGVSLVSGKPLTPFTLASPQDEPIALAVTGEGDVYWVTYDSPGSVIMEPQSSVPATTLASGDDYPVAIAVDKTNAYWADEGGDVKKMPLGGGTITTLASTGQTLFGLAVDSANVYFTNAGAGTVESVPIGGGPTVTLATGQNGPGAIAVDSSGVYWGDTWGGTVMRVPIGGGGAVTLASGQAPTVGLTTDSQYVYWTNLAVNDFPGTGTVVKLPK